jgi:hypothetical protein
VVRELEQEVEALAMGRPHRDRLTQLMAKKEIVGDLFNHLRLARQRALAGRQLGMSDEAADVSTRLRPGQSSPSVCC